jgi:two-component system, cell cycle sensor histidine kinase and response regulator CckA
MTGRMRCSGVDAIGELPWGTHFCLFYQTRQEWLEILVGYFQQGLLNHEFCLWVTSESLGATEAQRALRNVLPDLDERIHQRQIEFVDFDEWHLVDGRVDAARSLQRGVEKERLALDRGFEGMRISGNASWLENENWTAFTGYEATVNRVIGGRRILALCTYSLEKCWGVKMLDVLLHHPLALVKKEGKWEAIHSPQDRRTTEAIQQSEQRQKAILDTIPDPAWLKDENGHFLAVNTAWCRFFGVPAEKALGKTGKEFVPLETAEAFLEQDRRIMDSRQSLRFEELLADADGREVWFETVKSPLCNDDGEVVGTTGLARDITERKVDEREIERLNRLYAALSELNQIIVRVTCREELLREVCRIATEKAGFKIAWVGSPDPRTHQFLPIARDGDHQEYLNGVEVYSDDRPEGRGPTGTCFRGDKPCVINDFAADDRMAPWQAAAAARGLRAVAALPIRFHGKAWGTLTVYDNEPNVFQDKEISLLEEAAAAISFALESLDRERHRREAEERLRESESRLREAQKVACLGSYVVDIAKGLWTSSEVLDSIFDIPLDYVRSVEGWGDLVHPEERQSMLDYFRDEVLGKHESFDREYRIVRHGDHQVRWVHGLGRLEFDDAGNLVEMLGTIQDITRRKQDEEALQAIERRLLHAQKLESLGVLAGGIAHDFNNILAGIMGYADLAKIHLPACEPAHADIDVIKKAAHRAADLTRQMLAYSGKGKFVVGPVSLSQVVEDMRELLEISISKKAALRVHLASDLPLIEADASQIHQVILNLVVNASEALGEECGAIVISTGAVRSSIATDNAFGDDDAGERLQVRLEVTDTGCGMDAETLARIFDPFFTTKFTGRGLGLAAVHGIVRGHKGTIQVSSKPGQGTAFQVLFPALETPAPLPPVGPMPARPWRGGGTVLVVDDEELVRRSAQRMIEAVGYSVLTANNGEEAVRLYREHADEIACVLLDLTMPTMNGEETFRAIRRISPGIRVILSSGYSEDIATGRFSGLGLAGFLQKPYQLDTLTATLRNAVAGSHVHQKIE